MNRVFFALSCEWEEEAHVLMKVLEEESVSCTVLTQEAGDSFRDKLCEVEMLPHSVRRQDDPSMKVRCAKDGSNEREPVSAVNRRQDDSTVQMCCAQDESGEVWRRGWIVLTDSPELGKTLSHLHITYFGCGSAWFEGAALVLEHLDGTDAGYLEEWMLRAQGLPAVIAQTDRLLIREMIESDVPELARIGRQNIGALAGTADVFSEERLFSYIQNAYRFQGYGLWSVLCENRVIGCCGFAPPGSYIVEEQSSGKALSQNALELQYMLGEGYRRQGFGTEMCRAALAYARDRLTVDAVYLRIHPDNSTSLALAGKLGFMFSGDVGGTLLYRYRFAA